MSHNISREASLECEANLDHIRSQMSHIKQENGHEYLFIKGLKRGLQRPLLHPDLSLSPFITLISVDLKWHILGVLRV